MELKQCERCLKIVAREGVHTCTPTAGWRELEQQRDELLERVATLERDQEAYGPEKVSLQKQAWVEADRQRQINDLCKQRDQLLAALERFMDSHEECTDFDGFSAQIASMDDYHEAQEAIISVKGGAA